MNPIVVVVYWCMMGTNYSEWNPHQLEPDRKFVEAHHDVCHSEQVEMLDEAGLTVEQCKSKMMLYYMPGWKQKNADKDYLGGNCLAYHSPPMEALDLSGVKSKVQP